MWVCHAFECGRIRLLCVYIFVCDCVWGGEGIYVCARVCENVCTYVECVCVCEHIWVGGHQGSLTFDAVIRFTPSHLGVALTLGLALSSRVPTGHRSRKVRAQPLDSVETKALITGQSRWMSFPRLLAGQFDDVLHLGMCEPPASSSHCGHRAGLVAI